MDQPVYKLFLFKYTEAWYQLSAEEQQEHSTMVEETLKKVGGEQLLFCGSLTEGWEFWGVEKFPNMEALQKQAVMLYSQNHYRYVESLTFLGIDMPSAQKIFDLLR